MKLILFDIDGTLLRGDGVGRRAMEAALAEVVGVVSLANVPFGGNTDPAIVSAGLLALGVTPTPALIAAVLARYMAITRVEVARQNPFRALAGAVELVHSLRARGLPLGLGTGNIEEAARLKVEAIGLGDAFAFGGYGSDHQDRAELLRAGAHRGAAFVGRAPEDCQVLVIGDTKKDIAAARAIGADVLAVATGGEPLDSLRAHAPDHLAPSLDDHGALAWLLRWLG